MNDKLAALKEQLRDAAADRERLQQTVDGQEKSLTKLQHVLQQFTREKERDVALAQKDLAHQLGRARLQQAEKDAEIGQLRQKLAEAQLGLEAAGRLTQQLDKTSAALAAAKEEGGAVFFFLHIFFSFSLFIISSSSCVPRVPSSVATADSVCACFIQGTDANNL